MYSEFEPESTKELTNQAVNILDAKYENAILPQMVKGTCSHLKGSKNLDLLSLIQRYEQMFDGTLGN